jgi:hypothetical protein
MPKLALKSALLLSDFQIQILLGVLPEKDIARPDGVTTAFQG